MQADYKISEIVKLLRVSKNTVHDWIRAGTLKACNVAKADSKRPSYRITPQALEEFRKNRATVQEEPSAKPRSSRRQILNQSKRFF